MAQKTFPDYFADAGIEESTEIAEFQRALLQVQMVREMISLQVQVFSIYTILFSKKYYSYSSATILRLFFQVHLFLTQKNSLKQLLFLV